MAEELDNELVVPRKLLVVGAVEFMATNQEIKKEEIEKVDLKIINQNPDCALVTISCDSEFKLLK